MNHLIVTGSASQLIDALLSWGLIQGLSLMAEGDGEEEEKMMGDKIGRDGDDKGQGESKS